MESKIILSNLNKNLNFLIIFAGAPQIYQVIYDYQVIYMLYRINVIAQFRSN